MSSRQHVNGESLRSTDDRIRRLLDHILQDEGLSDHACRVLQHLRASDRALSRKRARQD
jgi:hypothetical protein